MQTVLNRPPVEFTALQTVAFYLTEPLSAVIAGADVQQVLGDARVQAVEQADLNAAATPTVPPFVVATPVPSAPATAAAATTITFGATDNQAQWAQLAQAFMADTPNIGVNIVTDGSTQSLTNRAASSDCFVWPAAPTPADYAALLDLQPLMDSDARFDLADYPPALRDQFTAAGRRYGLPYIFDAPVLAYRPAHFDDAGLAYPTADWQLDDLIRADEQLTTAPGNLPRASFVLPMKCCNPPPRPRHRCSRPHRSPTLPSGAVCLYPYIARTFACVILSGAKNLASLPSKTLRWCSG